MFYTEINIKGNMNPDWADWFEEMQVNSVETGGTVLCGILPDISAVYGVLSRLSSLGITLISVTCEEQTKTELKMNVNPFPVDNRSSLFVVDQNGHHCGSDGFG